jgi:N-acetylneuraminic acid mutarotase
MGLKNDFWEYDPITDVWTQKTEFGGSPRYQAAGFSIGNKGYIGTGADDQSETDHKDVWEYDASTNTWIRKADLRGLIRDAAVGFVIDNKGISGQVIIVQLQPV